MKRAKEREIILKSIFVFIPNSNDWIEFSTKCSLGTKKKKNVKFEASKVWTTNHGLSIFSDIRGSYSTSKEAYGDFSETVKKFGGLVENMTQKKLTFLEIEFEYPNGRHPYLLPKAVI